MSFFSITPTEIGRWVAIFHVRDIGNLSSWPANRHWGWIGRRRLSRIGRAGRDETKTDWQRAAIRAVHRYGYFLFLKEKEAHRNDNSQFTLFEFGHCITHVLKEEGAKTGDTRATAPMPSVRERPRQTGEVVVGRLGRGIPLSLSHLAGYPKG
jgi:hypothetical protein